MIIYVDIDNTICNSVEDDYTNSTPILENVAKVKSLIQEGHEVSFWTARGTVTGKDWTDVTNQQLESWGLGGIPVIFGKPYFDLFIDDRVMNVEDWK
jgi:CMP-N,N'-diacetyllegionaminic acid synthase